ADAIQAGYVKQAAAPRDGRRRELRLTAAGSELLEHARRHQRAQFDQLTAGWSAAERRAFARLFARFAAAALAGED
ncbi:MAG TPA: hypothetical protein VGE07_30080, partial [Herpetosiphonaceae bacterium]